jgi:hypothetical protein
MGHFKYLIVGYHNDKSAPVTLSRGDTFVAPVIRHCSVCLCPRQSYYTNYLL